MDNKFDYLQLPEKIREAERIDREFNSCYFNCDTDTAVNYYYFLAFHTEEQRNLFMDCYPDLIRQYLMIK